MALSPGGRARIKAADDAGCLAALAGIQTLRSFGSGEHDVDRPEEERWHAEAPDLSPIWVEILYPWRRENELYRPAAGRGRPE